jgi:agmatinase
MPSVGTPEPGGLTWDEVIDILALTAARKKIIGADIMELSPRPGFEYADFTAAKLAYKMIALSHKGR